MSPLRPKVVIFLLIGYYAASNNAWYHWPGNYNGGGFRHEPPPPPPPEPSSATHHYLRSPRICQCSFNDTAYLQNSCGSAMPFMTMIEQVLMSRLDITDGCRRAGSDRPPRRRSFDYIVVGAGVAGPILARRLSDDPSKSVLLIEAGPEEPTLSSVPAIAFNVLASDLNWKYTTEPQASACLKQGGRCSWARGKMVSGSGGANGMMYWRGHPEPYDQWAELGNPGWSYEELVPYWERAENPVNRNLTTFRRFDTGNPLVIDHFPHKPAFADEILRAASELGYRTGGLREREHTGFAVAPVLVKDGQRGTTSRYYLRPAADRTNLRVLTNAVVTKVLTRKHPHKHAYGVKAVLKDGQEVELLADREVILSAGTLGSPQILLNSGIGPKDDLAKVGVPLFHDLPQVGRNLQNHVSIGLSVTIRDNFTEALTLEALNQYLRQRSGPFASTGLTQVTAFLETKYGKPGVPDIQAFIDGYSSYCVKHGLAEECSGSHAIGNCSQRRRLNLRPTVVTTRSRGYMTLKSNDPLDYPLFYPNYFSDERDMKVLIEGIKKLLELMDTPTMKKYDMRLEDETPIKECANHTFGSDAYWECYIRQETGPENHQAGTCRMAPDGVVDERLRVRGVKNLRVADASIFPVLTHANTMAPVIVVAEKAADMIAEDAKNGGGGEAYPGRWRPSGGPFGPHYYGHAAPSHGSWHGPPRY
ncbi:hypothetical protein TKK_0003247 [Trichogramma kaykai]|uniref:Glucose-methanol-choline oxidoreductase N-terminal domain-containing protein n=1 Tax=Trichogramma kaykai TaxID=54128 RepID=A0ABD2WSZ0_9HYME